MLWQAMKTTVISGSTSRPSLFGSSVQQSQGFHAYMGSAANPTSADWYSRAKEALAKFDDLMVRVSRIGDQETRKTIQDWAGSMIVQGTPANRYQVVLTDIRQDVESFIPANVSAYQVPARTDKIVALESVNRDLQAMVATATAEHGVLPVDQGIMKPPPPPDPAGWLLPSVIVAGALGIAALVTYVYGGKS